MQAGLISVHFIEFLILSLLGENGRNTATLVKVAEILGPSWNFLRKDLEHCEHSTIHILLGASKNEYLRILGGEYSALDLYIRKLITDLRSLDISLVMFIDGAKGILEIQSFGLEVHLY